MRVSQGIAAAAAHPERRLSTWALEGHRLRFVLPGDGGKNRGWRQVVWELGYLAFRAWKADVYPELWKPVQKGEG